MQIAPGEASEIAAAVKAAPDLKLQMTRYVASLDEKLDTLDIAQQQAGQLRDRLQAQSS
jgi:hypothetical protein